MSISTETRTRPPDLHKLSLEDLQTHIKYFLTSVFQGLSLKNGKKMAAEDWTRTVAKLIELILPDYNFVICNYISEIQQTDMTDVILHWNFLLGQKIYDVIIFATGTIAGYKQTQKAFDFIYGKQANVQRSSVKEQPSRLIRLLTFKREKFVLVFTNKEFNKKRAILEGFDLVQNKMPTDFAAFYEKFHDSLPMNEQEETLEIVPARDRTLRDS